jgi:hypothetical protein
MGHCRPLALWGDRIVENEMLRFEKLCVAEVCLSMEIGRQGLFEYIESVVSGFNIGGTQRMN